MYNIIVNPNANGGSALKQWNLIEKFLKEENIKYSVYFTKSKLDSHRIIKSLNLETSKLYTLSGDGMVNEIINYKDGIKEIGLIPSGTGNDLAAHLNIKLTNEYLKSIFLDNNHIEIDVTTISIGNINQKFVNNMGIGFDADVVTDVNKSKIKVLLSKFGLGDLSYLVNVIKHIIKFRLFDLDLNIDDKQYHFKNVMVFTISNIKYIGGGMKICPLASNNDGIHDICIISNITKFKALKVLPTIYSGKHVLYDETTILTGKNIKANINQKRNIHFDGETGFKTDNISVVNQEKIKIYR